MSPKYVPQYTGSQGVAKLQQPLYYPLHANKLVKGSRWKRLSHNARLQQQLCTSSMESEHFLGSVLNLVLGIKRDQQGAVGLYWGTVLPQVRLSPGG